MQGGHPYQPGLVIGLNALAMMVYVQILYLSTRVCIGALYCIRLFTIHVNNLGQNVSNANFYADDTVVYLLFIITGN